MIPTSASEGIYLKLNFKVDMENLPMEQDKIHIFKIYSMQVIILYATVDRSFTEKYCDGNTLVL